MLVNFASQLKRELVLKFRDKTAMLTPVAFYLVVLSLFPLCLSTDAALLRQIAPGMIWLSVIFASFLGLGVMLHADFEDGTLEQWLCRGMQLWRYCLTKQISHWLTTSLPLVLATPLASLFFQLSLQTTWVLMCSLLLGTWAMSCLGAILIGLTIDLEERGYLLAILILPLYVPILILGTLTALSATVGIAVSGYFALLLALALVLTVLQPGLMAAALRITMS